VKLAEADEAVAIGVDQRHHELVLPALLENLTRPQAL
jgi:hypothetical protein